jgi:hypothetical protein
MLHNAEISAGFVRLSGGSSKRLARKIWCFCQSATRSSKPSTRYCDLLSRQYTPKTRFLGVIMPVQTSSRLQRLVQRDRRNNPPPNASIRLAVSSSLNDPDDPSDAGDDIEVVQTDEDSDFDDLTWSRVPHLEQRGKDYLKGPPS